jgi:adenylate kinase
MENKPDRSAWIKGGTAECDPQPQRREHPRRLVLLGAPGVGKGTQAELISGRLGPCQLSTGDVFRAAKTLEECDRTPAINAALEFMLRGELVPDDTVLNMVAERVDCLRCHGGFLLDGFPRTVKQAEALDEILAKESVPLEAVVSYEMPIEQIVERLSGRRTCPGCKAVYHVTGRPPRAAGVCDHCGSELYQREDDRPEAVRVRMEAYQTSTAPLTDYYSDKGLLVTVPADGTPEQIYECTLAALAGRS